MNYIQPKTQIPEKERLHIQKEIKKIDERRSKEKSRTKNQIKSKSNTNKSKNIADSRRSQAERIMDEIDETTNTRKSANGIPTKANKGKKNNTGGRTGQRDGRGKKIAGSSVKVPRGSVRQGGDRWVSGQRQLLREGPRIVYPKVIRAKGLQGRVEVEFVVNAAGRVISARALRASGTPKLDIKAVNKIRGRLYSRGTGSNRARVIVTFK